MIFTSQREYDLMRMFSGFKSQWISRRLCRYSSDVNTCRPPPCSVHNSIDSGANSPRCTRHVGVARVLQMHFTCLAICCRRGTVK
jgi:hypothetical protein